jgi:hypothetical protein
MRMLDALQWLMPAIVVLTVIVRPFSVPSSLCYLHLPSSLWHSHMSWVVSLLIVVGIAVLAIVIMVPLCHPQAALNVLTQS